MIQGNVNMKEMNLAAISQHLESFEETIVFKLIDRAQYAANEVIYKKGKSGFRKAGDSSLLDLRLAFQEKIDAQFGKFRIPEEQPFIENSAVGRKTIKNDNEILVNDCNAINLTDDIMTSYLSMVPLFCKPGDDGHYGSSAELDVFALQAISRRVHFGSFYAAECKYKNDPEGFDELIDAKDYSELLERLTRKNVEEKIIQRICEKSEAAQAAANREIRNIIKSEVIVDFYRQHFIPLTKRGQVLYLLRRNRKKSRVIQAFFPILKIFGSHRNQEVLAY
jgi:chorismate mutase